MLKVLVADDHALMREGIQIVLTRFDSELQLIDARNYDEVFQQLDEETGFDLVLLDLNMPGEKPLSGLRKVLATAGDTPVIVLSASENLTDIQQSIKSGARGYIPKSVSNEVLVTALKLVLSGGVYIPNQLFEHTNSTTYTAINDTDQDAMLSQDLAQPAITRRQKEVLELLAQGKPNKEIGSILGLSEGTVRTHVNAIFKLLNVNNRTQASVRARTLDLLSDNP